MKATKFIQRKDEEGWTQLSQEPFRVACCDCGLVHVFSLATTIPGQPIGIAVKRDNRATGQRRRRLKDKLPMTK